MNLRLKLQLHGSVLWVLLLVMGALALRILRLPLRWNQITLAYAAYQEPMVSALERGQWVQAASTFFGLHPPFYSFIFWAWTRLFPMPGAFLLLSALLSAAAVGVVGQLGAELGGRRVGVVASLLMAASLYHQHYSLEVNNYPLLVLMSALSSLTFLKVVAGKPRVWPWVLCATLCVWTHMLGGVLLLAQGMILVGRRRLAPLGWVLCLCLPLAPSVMERLTLGSTYHNETSNLGELWQLAVVEMVHRFGPPALLLLAAVLVGLALLHAGELARRLEVWSLGVCLGVGLVFSTLMTLLGIAAPHQHPYGLYLLPLWITLVALGLFPPRRSSRGMYTPRWGTLLLGGLLVVPDLASASRQVYDAWDHERVFAATPHPIRPALQAIATRPRSALWLVAPPLYPDDDKLAQDVVYAELSPWWRCVFYTPASLPFEFIDYSYGQPYACRPQLAPVTGPPRQVQLYVYTFADIYGESQRRLARFHLSQGTPVEVILYDASGSPDYLPRLRDLLKGIAGASGASLWERTEGGNVWWELLPPEAAP